MDTSITSPVRAASGTASPEPNPRGEETPWPRTRGTLPLSHTPPLPLFRPRRGMSLLEALATLVLVAVLVPASMQAVTISMRAAQQARQQQEASLLAESRLNEVIAAMPEIQECHRIGGDVDYLLKVVVEDMAGYDRTYKDLIARLPSLADVSALFSMERLKSATALPIPAET